MIVKSVIAGTVLSLMAGGVVYFGTEVDAGELTDKVTTKAADIKADISDKVMAGGKDHPHEVKIETPKEKTSVNTPSVKTPSGKLIEAKKPTVRFSSSSEEKTEDSPQNEALNPAETKPQKKWLNRYLKRDTAEVDASDVEIAEVSLPKTNVKTETVTTKTVVTEEIETKASSEGSSASDTGTFIVKDSSIDEDVDVKIINSDDGNSTIETETIDMGDGKIVKIIKKTIKTDSMADETGDMRIKVFTSKDGKGGLTTEDIEAIKSGNNVSIHKLLKEVKANDISKTVKVVMEQAEKIKMPELRDRAYLDLVSYGLEHSDYGVASKALKKIEQVELRDTARNRIAVTYAKDGDAEKAFAILDDLEVEALRDVMRLQVIEAMIAPEGLPEAMQ
ncbi:MAG: hypothetical protein ABJN69_04435 [Hellea sp.]